MKKILIITYDMIPHAFTWGGCQRMYYLAKKLLSKRNDVDVFAVRTAKYNTFGKELLPNVIFGGNTESEGKQTRSETTVPAKNKGMKGFLRKVAFWADPMFFNEITPGNGLQAYKFMKTAKKKLEQQLLAENYDVVIVSAPPFVIFNAIGLVKKLRPQTPVVMDYRDPWNSWHTGNYLCEHRERKLQEKADIIICTNQALCDDMSEKFFIGKEKYCVVENGFMDDGKVKENPEELYIPHDKMNIVYTGAIGFTTIPDGYRDTMPLLSAFEELVHEGEKGIRLVFVGESNSDVDYLEELKAKFGENLLVIGKVNNAKAKEYVRQSDVCLLLHTANDLSGKFLISGKAYDYIQAKKFIFSISRENSQHASILRQYGIGVNVDNEKTAIKSALQNTLSSWRLSHFDGVYDHVDIMRFSRDYQLEKYVEIIENTVTGIDE